MCSSAALVAAVVALVDLFACVAITAESGFAFAGVASDGIGTLSVNMTFMITS
jgi:hypothetical protein